MPLLIILPDDLEYAPVRRELESIKARSGDVIWQDEEGGWMLLRYGPGPEFVLREGKRIEPSAALARWFTELGAQQGRRRPPRRAPARRNGDERSYLEAI